MVHRNLELVRRVLSALTALTLLGCGPASPFAPQPDNGGGGQTFGPLTFAVPPDSEYLDQAYTLQVEGNGVRRVVFSVDGQPVLNDSNSPFRYEYDPSGTPEGTIVELELLAIGRDGQESTRTVEVVVRRPRPPLSTITATVNSLPGGYWYEVPRTWIVDSAWPDPNFDYGSVDEIIIAASGGTFDSLRNRLIVWGGGGPPGVWRNEIYAFDLRSFEWVRVTDPSPWPPGEEGNPNNLVTHPDNAPVTRHSFDQVEYLPPPLDKLYVGGGVVEAFQNGADPQVYLFDFSSGVWEPSTMTVTSSSRGAHVAVDANGIVWQQGTGTGPQARLVSVDVGANSESLHAEFQTIRGLGAVADIDPARGLFVATGQGVTSTSDLSDPDAAPVVRTTTGPKDAEAFDAPGFAYHPPSGKMVAWIGGSSVYALDLDTWNWEKIDALGGANPGLPASRGTFGRFRYSAESNVFVVVNSVRKNVFVFRLP